MTLSQNIRVALSKVTQEEQRIILGVIIDRIEVLREGKIVRGTIFYYTPILPEKKGCRH